MIIPSEKKKKIKKNVLLNIQEASWEEREKLMCVLAEQLTSPQFSSLHLHYSPTPRNTATHLLTL